MCSAALYSYPCDRLIVDYIPPHDHFLRQALKEAERAFEAGEVPVGAVVVRGGKTIGPWHNRQSQPKRPVKGDKLELDLDLDEGKS